MRNFISHIIFTILAAVTVSCSNSYADAVEQNLREAEMAVAQGDMTVAESVSNNILGDKQMHDLTPRQLGRLSLEYKQLADSADHGDHVSHATECYRKAFEINPDSANAFYNNVAPEHTAHAMLLSAIVHSTDIPTDSLHLDD